MTTQRDDNHDTTTDENERRIVDEGTEPSPFAELAYGKGRALLAWLGDDEAMHALLGHTPGPTDNLGALRAQLAVRRSALTARPPFEQGAAVVPIEDHRLNAAAARPDLAAEFFGMNWSTAFVDLREVLTFQKFVSMIGFRERVSTAATDSEALFELCLPATRPTYPTASLKGLRRQDDYD